MKRILTLFLCMLTIFVMCGCSLEYSEWGKEGNFTYAYGDKKAFVTEYRWDGTVEGTNIILPESFDGKEIISIGGYFGRGLPTPFTVDISAYFGEDVELVELPEGVAPDKTIELDFNLILPNDRTYEEIQIQPTQYFVREENMIVEYRTSTVISYAD